MFSFFVTAWMSVRIFRPRGNINDKIIPVIIITPTLLTNARTGTTDHEHKIGGGSIEDCSNIMRTKKRLNHVPSRESFVRCAEDDVLCLYQLDWPPMFAKTMVTSGTQGSDDTLWLQISWAGRKTEMKIAANRNTLGSTHSFRTTRLARAAAQKNIRQRVMWNFVVLQLHCISVILHFPRLDLALKSCLWSERRDGGRAWRCFSIQWLHFNGVLTKRQSWPNKDSYQHY